MSLARNLFESIPVEYEGNRPSAGDGHGPLPASEVPGPRSVPAVGWRGNAFKFFRNPVAYMSYLYETFGSVARLTPGQNRALFFRSSSPKSATFFAFGPDNARKLLTDLKTFETRRPPGPDTRAYGRLSTNMFFINGERHKQQRRLFMSAFARESLIAYYDDMVRLTRRMLDSWQVGQTVELVGELSDATLEIMSKTLYGVDATAKDQSLSRMMSDMVYALFSPVTMIPVNLPGTPYRKLIAKMERIDNELMKEIERKRAAGTQGSDLLSMMVRAHDEDPAQLTEDEMIGQAFTMFFAGHDTATKALTWTLFLIAQHPEVQADLLEELDQMLGGEPPSYEQIYQMPVLDRVVKESLRVLTPAVVFTREVTRDTVLGNYEIPAGSEVLYSPYIIHTDPAIYPEPKRFNPNRWLEIKPSAYEYLPFGTGARTCLGSPFGSMQLRIMVAMILQRFRLQVVPGTRIDLKTNVVIGPRNGLPMTVNEQDREFHKSKGEVRGYIRQMVKFS